MRTWNYEAAQCYSALPVDSSVLFYTTHTFHSQSLIQIYKVDKNYSEK